MMMSEDDRAVPYTCPSCCERHDAAADGLLVTTYHEQLWGLPNTIECGGCGADLVVVVHLSGRVEAELEK